MNIENREEIVEQLTDMLMDFEKYPNNAYYTDVYAYYDEETQTVELSTFVNPGGNSWIPDNHTTIHTDPPHYDSSLELFVNGLGGRSRATAFTNCAQKLGKIIVLTFDIFINYCLIIFEKSYSLYFKQLNLK